MTTPVFDPANSLTDHFLIAMPALRDPFFARSVVYLVQHNENGAFGIIVNKPIKMSISEVLDQLGIDDERPANAPQDVLYGGPWKRRRVLFCTMPSRSGPRRWPYEPD